MANFYKKSQIPSGGAKQEKSRQSGRGAQQGKSRQSARGVQQKKAQFGRSMVEMLGVLAIIGALSLVSISAYSVAMGKYQINKYRESLNLLINEAYKLLPELERQNSKGAVFDITLNKFFADTSMLPDGMNYDEKSGAIYDIFKNKNMIHYRATNDNVIQKAEYYIQIYMQRSEEKITPRDQEICRNILMVAQGNAENIFTAVVASYNSGGGSDSWLHFWGDFSNRGSMSWTPPNLIRNATLNDFDQACKTCKSSASCQVVIYFSSKF